MAVLLQVIGQMTMGLAIDYLQWILLACASVGFLLGVIIGPRSTKPKTLAGVKPEWPLVRPLDSYGFSERFFLPIAVISMLDFPELVAVAR